MRKDQKFRRSRGTHRKPLGASNWYLSSKDRKMLPAHSEEVDQHFGVWRARAFGVRILGYLSSQKERCCVKALRSRHWISKFLGSTYLMTQKVQVVVLIWTYVRIFFRYSQTLPNALLGWVRLYHSITSQNTRNQSCARVKHVRFYSRAYPCGPALPRTKCSTNLLKRLLPKCLLQSELNYPK